MANQASEDSFYEQIKQVVEENKGKVTGWRRWIGPTVLTVAAGAVFIQALRRSGLILGTDGARSGGSEDSDHYLVRCRSCGELVDESSVEDGECEDCFDETDGTTYCCGIMYTDGEFACRSCGEPL